eukprot:gnl/MRDRNA2_/MRDRNA2_109263_c0_seq1.p1 gnl/MRDRNA2_/MRDRNA2_109263_c0~~gnl/MRDRNA2_/MRDRNA2_109263_c0_seq1.p1  ORF type:complete len:534 (-),score=111.41 gnl/MRDRNA2_/MRDRNA2_109263_c0_seq1:185-1786(-)
MTQGIGKSQFAEPLLQQVVLQSSPCIWRALRFVSWIVGWSLAVFLTMSVYMHHQGRQHMLAPKLAIGMVTHLAMGPRVAAHNRQISRSIWARASNSNGQQKYPPTSLAELSALADAMELAARTENYAEAARLRDRLQEAEAANPVVSLKWRQQQQVRTLQETALSGMDASLEIRVNALRTLSELACPPAMAPGAEEALHKVMQQVTGEGKKEVQEAAETALWKCWLRSGDEDTDAKLQNGIELMNKNMTDAVRAFSEVIEADPDFAEGWNKRATALYALKRYDDSIEDCNRVLQLKPKHFGCLSGLGMCYLSKGSTREGLKYLQAGLAVHPGMDGPRQIVERVELQAKVEDHLAPEIAKVVNAFTRKDQVPVTCSEQLACSWDVHRMMPGEQESASATHVYFFRIRVKNLSPQPFPIRSLARFYVLHFDNGKVFPFTRLTEEDAQFMLDAGEEYKFCWALLVRHELRDIAMGMLLEQSDTPGVVGPGRFLNVGMAPLQPMSAPTAPIDGADQLVKDEEYIYTGQLDLRSVSDE